MNTWDRYGTEQKDDFIKSQLDPYELCESLNTYKDVFGEGFTINNMIDILKVRAIAELSEAIANTPEYFVDQVSKYRKSDSRTINDSIDKLADSIVDTFKK